MAVFNQCPSTAGKEIPGWQIFGKIGWSSADFGVVKKCSFLGGGTYHPMSPAVTIRCSQWRGRRECLTTFSDSFYYSSTFFVIQLEKLTVPDIVEKDVKKKRRRSPVEKLCSKLDKKSRGI